MAVTWDFSLLKLVNVSYDLVASSIEGGRALDGLTGAIDFSGGGLWRMSASIELYAPEEHRAWWRMAAILNGGVNSIVMPFRTDRINFDPNVAGFDSTLVGDHAVGATTCTFKVTSAAADGALVQEGMIFGLVHIGSVLHRTYLVKKIVSASTDTGTSTTHYEVIIRPALRAAKADGGALDWSQPGCRMRLPSGTTMRWDVTSEQFWLAQNSIDLIEALPVEDPAYA